MICSWRGWSWKLRLASFLAMSGVLIITSGDCVFAQSKITPDNTLPTNSRVTSLDDDSDLPIDRIDNGTIRGTNLFHSFLEFNVSKDRGAYFLSPNADIQNILARVTGGNPSEILGTLGTFGESNPNLFLMNPNGVIFGKNASLDVGGSFVATTANGIQLGDTGLFSASEPATSNLLTINPSALFFNAVSTQREIVNLSRVFGPSGETNSSGGPIGLQVPNGQTLALVGGNLLLDDGNLTAKKGRIELGSVRGLGQVGLNQAEEGLVLDYKSISAFGEIRLENTAVVDVSAGGGGSIAVTAGDIDVLGGSSLYAGIRSGLGSPEAQAGNIMLYATETITLTNSGIFNLVDLGALGSGGDIDINTTQLGLDQAQIVAVTNGEGNTGDVLIEAKELVEVFNGGLLTNQVNLGVGNAGDLKIETRQLSIRDGGLVSADTFGEGNAGNLLVQASNSVEVAGESSFLASDVNSDATGQGGNLTIETGQLRVRDGAQVSASTFGEGDAGSLLVQANSIELSGTDAEGVASGLFAQVNPSATGTGGDLIVEAAQLSVTDGAEVSVSARGEGDAGRLLVQANSIELSGTDAEGDASGLFAQVGSGAIGTGGSLTIDTEQLVARDGAQVSASTFGEGNAGGLSVRASESVELSGVAGEVPSGLFADIQLEATGAGGDLNIETGKLLVQDGAQVSASTFDKGNAGGLSVRASEVALSKGGALRAQVNSGAEGSGGDLRIEAGKLLVQDGAEVSTGTFGKGDAGSLILNAVDVELTGESSTLTAQVNSGARGNGGDLRITTDKLSIKDGAQVSASTFGAGDAGNLSVLAADSIELTGTDAEGYASGLFTQVGSEAKGDGGNLTVETGRFSVRDGAGVSVDTFGAGNAGNLAIDTSSLVGKNTEISTSTRGEGNAGNLTVRASESIELSGEYRDQNGEPTGPGGLLAQVDLDAKGQGGNLTVETKRLSISNGSKIQAATFGDGNAGEIKIRASEIDVFNTPDANNTFPTEINAGSTRDVLGRNINSPLKGNGGTLTIETGSLFLTNGASITSRSGGRGNAGNLTINVRDTLQADNGEISASSDQAGGGKIDITAPDIRLRNSSPIITSVFNGEGGGGNITINSDTFIAFDDSDILANAEFGSGGNITINSHRFLAEGFGGATAVGRNPGDFAQFRGNGRVDVSASSRFGTSGTVAAADSSFLQNSLTPLSANFISPEQVVAGSCLARRNAEQGSFTVTGTGGLPRSPYEAISGRYNVTGVQPIQGSGPVSQGAEVVESTAWKKGDPIQEAQGMVVTADGRTIVGTNPQLVALAKAQNLVCHSD